MDASGVGARSGLPWTACATPEGSAKSTRRAVVMEALAKEPRNKRCHAVEDMLRAGNANAKEVAAACEVSISYVSIIGSAIGIRLKNTYVKKYAVRIGEWPRKPRDEAAILADLGRQLESIVRRWDADLTVARCEDPI